MSKGGKTSSSSQSTATTIQTDNRVGVAEGGIYVGGGSTVENLSDDVAIAVVSAAETLGESAFSLVNEGLEAQAKAQEQNNALARDSMEIVTASTKDTLEQTLAVIGDGYSRAFDLAERGQNESAAAREAANETIKEVLSFKEAGDTKVAGDLIRYGAIAVGIIAAAFLFRKKA